MRKYRLESDSPSDGEPGKNSKGGKYTFKAYEGENIRYPEYVFQTPETEKIIDVLSEDIVGTWKGSPILKVAEYTNHVVAPYSHDIDYQVPEGINIKCQDPNTIEISGANKAQVGQVAADIRSYRKPEPYKGKGIKYENEYIFRKEGKKK